MQDRPTNTLAVSRYEVIAGRFQLLAIAPTATNAQVEQAFTTALGRGAAPDQDLIEARDKILDPAQRLLSELAYPLDSTAGQIGAFYADLAGNVPATELLPAANKLPPLSRANFLALLAARHGADFNLLLAFVDAHAAVDAPAIFEILKDLRTRAGFPTPSLVDVSQGLQELLALHSEAVIIAYDKIQSAASPLLECVREIISSNDQYRLVALHSLLDAYRWSLASLTEKAHHGLDAALTTIKERPDDSSLNQFETALNDWVSPIAPLILFDAHQHLAHDGFDEVVARARGVLADLIARGDHRESAKSRLHLF